MSIINKQNNKLIEDWKKLKRRNIKTRFRGVAIDNDVMRFHLWTTALGHIEYTKHKLSKNNAFWSSLTNILIFLLLQAAAHVSRNWNYVVRRGLSLTLSGIAPTVNISRTIDELLFTGYPDTLTKMAKTFPFFAGTEIPPWERFGWFYKVSKSAKHWSLVLNLSL